MAAAAEDDAAGGGILVRQLDVLCRARSRVAAMRGDAHFHDTAEALSLAAEPEPRERRGQLHLALSDVRLDLALARRSRECAEAADRVAALRGRARRNRRYALG